MNCRAAAGAGWWINAGFKQVGREKSCVFICATPAENASLQSPCKWEESRKSRKYEALEATASSGMREMVIGSRERAPCSAKHHQSAMIPRVVLPKVECWRQGAYFWTRKSVLSIPHNPHCNVKPMNSICQNGLKSSQVGMYSESASRRPRNTERYTTCVP